MALNPPPERKRDDKAKQEEIDKIINKGGKVVEESFKEEKAESHKWTMISVRLPEKMLKEIDKKIDNRPGLSRNAWILESFQEKLKN